jgi:tetratricopeptide (TPR) repeat protein
MSDGSSGSSSGSRARARRVARTLASAALLALALGAAAAAMLAQEAVSPLPPPVTRGQYRANWFEFLTAFSENDQPGADRALEAMARSARKLGVHRLSDFSRTAVYLGRRAEILAQKDRAARAYDAALRLDPDDADAVVARVSFLARTGRLGEALKSLPSAAVALFATRESRVAILSNAALWLAVGVAGALAGIVLTLCIRHLAPAAHDVAEFARWRLGAGAALPVGIAVVALPLLVGFGPGWLVLYWAALIFPYAATRERRVLAGALVALALVPPLLAVVTRVNIEQRSPLFVAALDLAERREDASAEDGLRQASAVFPEDSDVWFLLGVYAERSGDYERAQDAYTRAMRADPTDYRPVLNRGNVRFTEGDFNEAIRDYIEAAKLDPDAPEVFYNLALARGEAYDFDGQSQAITRARAISASRVSGWVNAPTVSRVVPAPYSLARARSRIAQWNAQPKSRRLPGHGAASLGYAIGSAWSLPPIGALALGLLLNRFRRSRGVAAECARCGRPFCVRCRRYGDAPGYCAICARSFRKEEGGIEEQAAEALGAQRRARGRHRASRIASLLAPGAHKFGFDRPAAAAVTMLVFFCAVGAVLLDNRFFDPLSLPPEGPVRGTVVVGLAVAFLIWVRAQWLARRVPSGS